MSVKVNNDKQGLISALTKIDKWVAEYTKELKYDPSSLPSKFSALYFASNKTHLLDDHPSTKARIERLQQM